MQNRTMTWLICYEVDGRRPITMQRQQRSTLHDGITACWRTDRSIARIRLVVNSVQVKSLVYLWRYLGGNWRFEAFCNLRRQPGSREELLLGVTFQSGSGLLVYQGLLGELRRRTIPVVSVSQITVMPELVQSRQQCGFMLVLTASLPQALRLGGRFSYT